VGFDQQDFGLIEVKDYDTKDRCVGVPVADEFHDFVSIELEERRQFF
jgi:hypothetical protein